MVRAAAASTKRGAGCQPVRGTSSAEAACPARNMPARAISSRRLRAASTRLARNRICTSPPSARATPDQACESATSAPEGGSKRSVAFENPRSKRYWLRLPSRSARSRWTWLATVMAWKVHSTSSRSTGAGNSYSAEQTYAPPAASSRQLFSTRRAAAPPLAKRMFSKMAGLRVLHVRELVERHAQLVVRARAANREIARAHAHHVGAQRRNGRQRQQKPFHTVDTGAISLETRALRNRR